MSFPQASDYRPPIIPDGELYDNPDNGKSYYWTQILLPEGSTPDTATSIGGYWTVVCPENKFLLRHGDTVDDCEEPAEYSWNDDVQFESTGLKGVLLPKKIKKQETDEKHIANKEYVDIQDGILRDENNATNDFTCARFLKLTTDFSEIAETDGNRGSITDYNNGNFKIWAYPSQGGFFVSNQNYYIDDQGPYEITSVVDAEDNTSFVIKNAPDLTFSTDSYTSFSKTRKLCTEIDFLQNEIIELEEEINAIAPSVDYGTWEWQNPSTFGRPPAPGTFYLSDIAGNLTTEYKSGVKLFIHNDEWDNPGDTILPLNHTWADADVGKLIQLFDAADPDFMLGEITDRAIDAVGNFVIFTIEIISSLGQPNDNLDQIHNKYLTRINIFNAPKGEDVGVFLNKTRSDEIGLEDNTNVVYDVACADSSDSGVEFKLKTDKDYFKVKSKNSTERFKVTYNEVTIKKAKLYDGTYVTGNLNVGYANSTRVQARKNETESNKTSSYTNSTGDKGEVLHSNGTSGPPYWKTPQASAVMKSGTLTSPSLARGEMYWNYNNFTIYVGK